MPLEGQIRLSLGNLKVSVDLFLGTNEYVVLLGPSGAGKSLTLKALAGFFSGVGKVVLNGCDVSSMPPEKRNIVYLPQGNSLFPHLTVRENLLFPFRAKRRPPEESFLSEVIRIFRLEDLLDRLPKTLSGGEAQRVALARAVCAQPLILLLDEPLSSLDFHLKLELIPFMRQLPKRFSLSILQVTHDPLEALFLADRIYLMREGRLVFAGSRKEFEALIHNGNQGPLSQGLSQVFSRFADLIKG